MEIEEQCPDNVLKVRYEDILQDKANIVKEIHNFIGRRRFTGALRQSSVMFMKSTEDLVDRPKKGSAYDRTSHLSHQFKSLGRGESLVRIQLSKWKNPSNRLKPETIEIIESVAHEVMSDLGYETHLVGEWTDPRTYSEEQIEVFEQKNQEGLEKINRRLKLHNVSLCLGMNALYLTTYTLQTADFERRNLQAQALKLPMEIVGDWTPRPMQELTIPVGGTPKGNMLTERELIQRLNVSPTKMSSFTSGRTFRFASATQRGYYPNQLDQPNQDKATITTNICATSKGQKLHYFACLDGHVRIATTCDSVTFLIVIFSSPFQGPDGHHCAEFAAEMIPSLFSQKVKIGAKVITAMETAHEEAHQKMVTDSEIEAQLSGTTVITAVIFDDGKWYVTATSPCQKPVYHFCFLFCPASSPTSEDPLASLVRLTVKAWYRANDCVVTIHRFGQMNANASKRPEVSS